MKIFKKFTNLRAYFHAKCRNLRRTNKTGVREGAECANLGVTIQSTFKFGFVGLLGCGYVYRGEATHVSSTATMGVKGAKPP